MSGKTRAALLWLSLLCLCLTAPAAGTAGWRGKGSSHKIYVILGFHANFYHSWRGDTNDEAGFGTDIRIVRAIIRMLDEANARGLDARGYWEGESLFTFEDIIPKYAPDIIEGIRRRIDAGLDEFVPAPYSNTLFSAVTEDEMRAVVSWSVHNPWGSGAQDLFKSWVPLIRPQEAMTTTGQAPILLDEGFKGVILPYSSYSFTAFSNFVKPLPPEQRYGLTWMRMRDDGPRMLLFPCVSAADVVNHVSLEKWMLELRKLQTSGKVDKDLVIHINFDADSETWLPLIPPPLKFPNGGGLDEYIEYVNKYDWAEFTTPGEFMATHKPEGEVVIRQDTADGGWDGNYSWAEKYPSHRIWTGLEKSRMYTQEALALLKGAPAALSARARALLYDGRVSSFFLRIRGLSTTHFGMSTPMVNEQRQAKAENVAHAARDQADQARRMAAKRIRDERKKSGRDSLYSFLVRDTREQGHAARTVIRIPVVLPEADADLAMTDESGEPVRFSLVNPEEMPDKRLAAEIMAVMELKPGEDKVLTLKSEGASAQGPEKKPLMLKSLDNDLISLELDREKGVKSFVLGAERIGGDDFLSPFITYRQGKKPMSYRPAGYEFADLAQEKWDGLERARLVTSIPFPTPHGKVEAKLSVTFTVADGLPWAIADVDVSYPYTVKEDLLHNAVQKLRRYLDLSWIEVAPFQLHPLLDATRSEPIKTWKHNYLGVTSWYEMNYGQINPKNAQLDSFNHQVTASWVAVTDRKKGLLTAQCAEVLSSYAFMPMRLREADGQKQRLWLNPFGSYYGRQMDYSHMGGNGLGSEIADVASSALRPNGPSYNGMKERFSLMLAPYLGDEPGEELQADAELFFHPPAVVYLSTPAGVDALLKTDVIAIEDEARRERAMKSDAPLPAPLAFLANPTDRAVHLVWDEPDDVRIQGYELAWRKAGDADWTVDKIGRADRHQVPDLDNGGKVEFRMRSVGAGRQSDWTDTQEVTVGPVKTSGVLSLAKGVKPGVVFKTIWYALDHLLTTP